MYYTTVAAPIYAKPLNPKDEYFQVLNEIKEIENSGEVAPPGAWICIYNVKHRYRSKITGEEKLCVYHYVKLMTPEAAFPSRSRKRNNTTKFVKHRHLGKVGSDAHIEAMRQICRRDIIQARRRFLTMLEEWYGRFF